MKLLSRAGQAATGAIAVALLATLLCACSLSNPFGASAMGPPLPTLARDAVANYDRASSVHVRGSYQVGQAPVTIDLSLQPSSTGLISGRGTYKGDPLSIVGRGGTAFTKGLAYWQAQGAGSLQIWSTFGQDWVQAPGDDPGAAALVASRDLGGLVAQLAKQGDALRSDGTSELDGHQIVSLRDGLTTYDVTTQAPYRVLAVRRAGRSASPGGLSRINLQVQYHRHLQVTLPTTGQFVNPRDASTFPALYQVQSTTDTQSCDKSSCGYSATLLNAGGAADGQTTATLGLYQDQQDTKLIGSCQVPVPAVPNGQTTTVTCRITDASYVAFYASITTGTPVYRHVTLQNPPYN